ncbi:MAG: S8 family peptidase [Burkholderiaceae bacterium]
MHARSRVDRVWRGWLLAIFLIGGSAAAVPVADSPDTGPANGLIVKLRTGAASGDADTPRLARAMAAAGVAPLRLRAVGRAHHVAFAHPLERAEAAVIAQRLRDQPEVEWVVPNTRERRLDADSPPNDPLFVNQWWLHSVAGSNANAIGDRRRGVPGFDAAWRNAEGDDKESGNGTGKSVVVVAVLDTGITAHPDLDANVLQGHDFVSGVDYANDGDGRDTDASDPGDWVSQADRGANPALFGSCSVQNSRWHGTVIAGIVAAATGNGVGVAGANGSARVLPVRVAGKCGAELADIVDGMRWAAGLAVAGAPRNPHPARIINLSYGGNAPCNAAYQDTIDEIAAQGVVLIAAAGNGHGATNRPANCARVIGVAALNRDGFKASYSNFGPEVAISTVGGDASEGAWTALLGDGGLFTIGNSGTRGPGLPVYGAASGTSFAAPMVAATVSLMLAANPKLSAAQIIAGLAASARPHVVASRIAACSALNPGRCICSTATCGAGILDAAQALVYARSPARYQAPNWPRVDLDSAAEVVVATALGIDRPGEPGFIDAVPASATEVPGDGRAGGGALGEGWLLGLALALLALRRADRH